VGSAVKRTELKRKVPLHRRPSEITKTCARPGCERTFNCHPNQPKRYCSRDCRYAVIRLGRQRVCAQCGVQFLTYAPSSKGKFCSMACMQKFQRHDWNRRCVICGEGFQSPATGRQTRKTCSKKCAAEATRRGKLGRKNPNYRNGRTANAERWRSTAEPQCRQCGSSELLRLHHVVYEQHVRKHGGDSWDPDNGLTLCLSCHSKHHNGTDKHVPIAVLRPENLAFAFALLGDYAADYFFRYYHADRDEVQTLLELLPHQLSLEVA
jgi:hypothetical protein